jgi:hypothetical protein
MPSTDLDITQEYLVRIRRIYPAAIGTGHITGSRHMVRAEVRRMEKRGEIVSVRRFAREIAPGVLEIPYVRLKTRGAVRKSQAVRIGLFALAGLGVATGAGYLIWESRVAIVTFAGALAAGAALLYLSLHWRNGCPGIHCQGCGG